MEKVAGGWTLWRKEEWESHKAMRGKTETESSPQTIYRADVVLVMLLLIEVVVSVKLPPHAPTSTLWVSFLLSPSLLVTLVLAYSLQFLFTPLDLTFIAQLPLRTSSAHSPLHSCRGGVQKRETDGGGEHGQRWGPRMLPYMCFQEISHRKNC